MHRRTDARASPYAARSTHGYTDTHTHRGFRRRPATQELPLTQHGRRTDSRGARNIPMPLTATRQQPNVATSVLFMFLLICLHGRYWHVNINKKIDRSIYK